MGHGPQNPTPTFHFVKIIFSHLILMGQDPRLSKHKQNSCDTDGAGSSIVQAYFCRDTDGARTTQSDPTHTKKVDTDGAGSTIVQALCVNYYFFT